MAKNASNVIGSWAFLIGVILAVVLGFMNIASNVWTITLVAIGIIVGLLNIADKEAGPFLLSGAVLVIVSSLGQGEVGAIPALGRVLEALLTIFVPATIIVAIKNVFGLAKH